jgi:hypothetical protein
MAALRAQFVYVATDAARLPVVVLGRPNPRERTPEL